MTDRRNIDDQQLQEEIEQLVDRQETLGHCRVRERLIICLCAKRDGIELYALV